MYILFQIFINDIAAKMHHLVEHKEPNGKPTVAKLFKVELDVQNLMLKVRREGDVPTSSTAALPLAKQEPK